MEVLVPEATPPETYLEIRDLETGQRVVTVVEVISPTNKYSGPRREAYVAKQREVVASSTHLVEVDLLRYGPHVLAVPEAIARNQGDYDYLTSVNRAAGVRNLFQPYARPLRQRLPRVALPLADGDPDVTLDLQAAVARTYEMGSFRERLNYRWPCVPPLSPGAQVWADELIRAAESEQ